MTHEHNHEHGDHDGFCCASCAKGDPCEGCADGSCPIPAAEPRVETPPAAMMFTGASRKPQSWSPWGSMETPPVNSSAPSPAPSPAPSGAVDDSEKAVGLGAALLRIENRPSDYALAIQYQRPDGVYELWLGDRLLAASNSPVEPGDLAIVLAEMQDGSQVPKLRFAGNLFDPPTRTYPHLVMPRSSQGRYEGMIGFGGIDPALVSSLANQIDQLRSATVGGAPLDGHLVYFSPDEQKLVPYVFSPSGIVRSSGDAMSNPQTPTRVPNSTLFVLPPGSSLANRFSSWLRYSDGSLVPVRVVMLSGLSLVLLGAIAWGGKMAWERYQQHLAKSQTPGQRAFGVGARGAKTRDCCDNCKQGLPCCSETH